MKKTNIFATITYGLFFGLIILWPVLLGLWSILKFKVDHMILGTLATSLICGVITMYLFEWSETKEKALKENSNEQN